MRIVVWNKKESSTAYKKMYDVNEIALMIKDLSANAFVLFMLLSTKTKGTHVNKHTLAKDIGKSISTVTSATKELKDKGYYAVFRMPKYTAHHLGKLSVKSYLKSPEYLSTLKVKKAKPTK